MPLPAGSAQPRVPSGVDFRAAASPLCRALSGHGAHALLDAAPGGVCGSSYEVGVPLRRPCPSRGGGGGGSAGAEGVAAGDEPELPVPGAGPGDAGAVAEGGLVGPWFTSVLSAPAP